MEHAPLGDRPFAPERPLGLPAGELVRGGRVPRHRVPRSGSPQVVTPVMAESDQPILAVSHEVPLVGRQVEAQERLSALGHRPRLVATEAGEPVLELVEVLAQRRLVVPRDQARDRHVAPLEDRTPRLRPGGHLDLERLAEERRIPERGEPADGRPVIGPRLGRQEGLRHPVGRRDLDRRVGMPDLLGGGRARRGQLLDTGQLESSRRGGMPPWPPACGRRFPSPGARHRRRPAETSRRAADSLRRAARLG